LALRELTRRVRGVWSWSRSPPRARVFTFRLDRAKLRRARLREGRYLLRTNLPKDDPAKLWDYYIRLVEVEQAFKALKRRPGHPSGVPIRPRLGSRHISYCLPGLQPERDVATAVALDLTPRAVLDDFAGAQMIDVHIPTGAN
jgi:hypothetical protein